MAAIFDANWWNFPTSNDYLEFTNVNGEWSFSTTGQNFTLMALIEVPALGAGPHGVMGKRYDASTLKYEEDYGIYLISSGGSSYIRCVIGNSVDANDYIQMVTPITYDTPTLVVLRYTYVGAGNVNTLEAIFVDSTGLTKTTLNTADDATMSSINTPFWVGGRNGITGLGGKIFWSALFNSKDGLGTSLVSDADLLAFYAQTKHPCESGDTCTFFIDFHQAVAATYVADHTEMETINKPLSLTTQGAPTKGGSSITPTFPPDPVNSGWSMDYVSVPGTDTRLVITKNALAATLNLIPTDDFTFAISYTRQDDTVGRICVPFDVGSWSGGDASFGSYLYDITGAFRTYVSSDGTAVDFDDLATATELNNQNIVGMYYDFQAPGDINPHTQFRAHRTAAGIAFESASEDYPGPIFDPTPDSPQTRIGHNLGVDSGGKSSTLYWIALYHTLLTQQDIEDLTSGKKHPVDDFTPVLYVDFHKAVGASYTPEVGTDYVYGVEGSPALIGLGESSLRTDYPPSVVTATLTTATNIRVLFDSPMENNAALNLVTNYVFSGGLSAVAITVVDYCTLDLTVSGNPVSGEALTVSNVEDILGTQIFGTTAPLLGVTPTLHLNPSILTFNATLTHDAPQTQTIDVTNVGAVTLDPITVSGGADWLTVWLGGSGNTQQIMNRVDIEGLPLGVYSTTVTVLCSNASNSPITYLVTLTISAHANPTSLQPNIIIWVAKTGNDSTGTGSQQNPYFTIERALQEFVNGSQIRILNGTYTPADTIVINGLEGSIFSETPGGAVIQPQRTTQYGAGIAIINSNRFTVQGVHIKQSTETQTATSVANTIGLYATNIQNFVAHTVTVSDFVCPSGCAGIWAIGSGRIEQCLIEDLTSDNGDLYGIYANGILVSDSTVRRLSNKGNDALLGIYTVSDYVIVP